MISKPFYINTKDFTQYVHRSGMSVQYTPIAGLPEEYTMDGTLHSDILTNKATYTIRMNPMPPAIVKQLITECRLPEVLLTLYDVATDAERTIYCKSVLTNVTIAMVKASGITHWQLSDLVFVEK